MLGNGRLHGGFVKRKVGGQGHAHELKALQARAHGVHHKARLGGQDGGTGHVAGHGQQRNEFVRAVAQHQRITRGQVNVLGQGLLEVFDALSGVTVDGHSAQALTQGGLQRRGQGKGIFHRIELDHPIRCLDGIGMHRLDVLANKAKGG